MLLLELHNGKYKDFDLKCIGLVGNLRDISEIKNTRKLQNSMYAS